MVPKSGFFKLVAILLVIFLASSAATTEARTPPRSFSFSYDEKSFSFGYEQKLEQAVQEIEGHFLQDPEYGDAYELIIVGEKERVKSDLACGCKHYTYSEDHFVHIEEGEAAYEGLPLKLQKMVDFVNSFTKLPQQPWNQDNTHTKCRWLGLHTLGLLTKEGSVADALHKCGFGLSVWEELRVYSTYPAPIPCGRDDLKVFCDNPPPHRGWYCNDDKHMPATFPICKLCIHDLTKWFAEHQEGVDPPIDPLIADVVAALSAKVACNEEKLCIPDGCMCSPC